jgi:hypothetical protein
MGTTVLNFFDLPPAPTQGVRRCRFTVGQNGFVEARYRLHIGRMANPRRDESQNGEVMEWVEEAPAWISPVEPRRENPQEGESNLNQRSIQHQNGL